MQDPEDFTHSFDSLEKWEKELRKREEALIDNVTMQAIALVILKMHRSKGRIKPAALNEIRHARTAHREGEYDPRAQLARILDDTLMDKEERRESPPRTR